MSFCFLYNVVSENYSVQNSPWGGEGGLLPAQGLYCTARQCCQIRVVSLVGVSLLSLVSIRVTHLPERTKSILITGLSQKLGSMQGCNSSIRCTRKIKDE